jgi:DNA polymerase III delta subunit
MIVLLYGPDTYAKQHKLRELRAGIAQRNPEITQGNFDMEQSGDLIALHEFTAVSGLFSQGKRMAVVRNALAVLKDSVFEVIVSRAGENPDIVLFLYESREKKLEAKEEKFCKKHGIQVQYFGKPTEATVRAQVQKHAQHIGMEIDERALAFLIAAHGADTAAIITDIDKWSAVTKKLDAAFLSKTGEYVSETGVFDFSQALVYGKPLRDRLALFEKLLSQHADFYAPFNITAKMTASGELINALADADLKIKRGLLDIEQAMLAVVLG